MISDDELKAIEARADQAASASSDDFGHSVQLLLEFESRECTYFTEQVVPRLCAELRATRALFVASEDGHEFEMVRLMKEENARLREALKELSVESPRTQTWRIEKARAALRDK